MIEGDLKYFNTVKLSVDITPNERCRDRPSGGIWLVGS